VYLAGDFRLGPSEEAVLRALDFRVPESPHPDASLPRNWWLDVEHADPRAIAELLMAAMIRVMCFDERWPVTINIFGAESPCATCFRTLA
jgi:hypothetical protein